jgi:hypothetical protein
MHLTLLTTVVMVIKLQASSLAWLGYSVSLFNDDDVNLTTLVASQLKKRVVVPLLFCTVSPLRFADLSRV